MPCEHFGPGGFDELRMDGRSRKNRAPFLSPEEERAAEQRIDGFMADVLIPLAAQTNASSSHLHLRLDLTSMPDAHVLGAAL